MESSVCFRKTSWERGYKENFEVSNLILKRFQNLEHFLRLVAVYGNFPFLGTEIGSAQDGPRKS
jgi:hypothetical protein